MPRIRIFALTILLLLPGSSYAQDTPTADAPIPTDTVEESTVRLMILDVVVLDRRDRTVADLTKDDFEIQAAGDLLPVDTLDVACEEGAIDEPRAVARPSRRTPAAGATGGRKIVFALDYLHLSQMERAYVLEESRAMVNAGAAESDEIMVAALNGGLRVEQTFTADTDEVLRTLKRMEYDITLWEPSFTHMNEFGFVESLSALFDVLGTVDGPKAVVLFSAMADVPLDLQFQKLAGVASASRCSVYPVDIRGLMPPELGTDTAPG